MHADAKLIHGILAPVVERFGVTHIAEFSSSTTRSIEQLEQAAIWGRQDFRWGEETLEARFQLCVADRQVPFDFPIRLPAAIGHQYILRALLELERSHGVKVVGLNDTTHLEPFLPRASIRERFIELTN